jgi:hypothetical protein
MATATKECILNKAHKLKIFDRGMHPWPCIPRESYWFNDWGCIMMHSRVSVKADLWLRDAYPIDAKVDWRRHEKWGWGCILRDTKGRITGRIPKSQFRRSMHTRGRWQERGCIQKQRRDANRKGQDRGDASGWTHHRIDAQGHRRDAQNGEDASGRTHQREDADCRRMERMHLRGHIMSWERGPGQRGCIRTDASWDRWGHRIDTQDGGDASGRTRQRGDAECRRRVRRERMHPGGCINGEMPITARTEGMHPGRHIKGKVLSEDGGRGCIRADALQEQCQSN